MCIIPTLLECVGGWVHGFTQGESCMLELLASDWASHCMIHVTHCCDWCHDVLEVSTVTSIDAVLGQCQLAQQLQAYVSCVLCASCLDGKACLSYMNLTTFTRNAVYTWDPEAHGIFSGLKVYAGFTVGFILETSYQHT